jgi:hypothetical protein
VTQHSVAEGFQKIVVGCVFDQAGAVGRRRIEHCTAEVGWGIASDYQFTGLHCHNSSQNSFV